MKSIKFNKQIFYTITESSVKNILLPALVNSGSSGLLGLGFLQWISHGFS